jgi:hypothetical protein
LLFHANNTLNITFKRETIAPRIVGRVSPFFQNYACFHKDFLGNQSLVQKQKSCWCLFKQTSSENSGDSLER